MNGRGSAAKTIDTNRVSDHKNPTSNAFNYHVVTLTIVVHVWSRSIGKVARSSSSAHANTPGHDDGHFRAVLTERPPFATTSQWIHLHLVLTESRGRFLARVLRQDKQMCRRSVDSFVQCGVLSSSHRHAILCAVQLPRFFQ